MKKIKKMFTIIIIATLGITALVAISLHGERDYLKNCKVLGIKCQPGNVHQATEVIAAWTDKMIQKIRTKMSEQTSEETQSTPSVSQQP